MEQDFIRIGIILIVAFIVLGLNNALNPDVKIKIVLWYIGIGVALLFLISPVVDVINQALHSVHGS